MKKFFNSTILVGYCIYCLFHSLILTATSSNYTRTARKYRGQQKLIPITLENVPIDIKYDTDKYLLVGYSYETEVYLTSINRVKLDSEINNDTRSF